eukprot:m.2030 g.2030  ORF g.2030 m.2030 type:complete len:654 (+) comp1701_c0_seq1:113-2074(+)
MVGLRRMVGLIWLIMAVCGLVLTGSPSVMPQTTTTTVTLQGSSQPLHTTTTTTTTPDVTCSTISLFDTIKNATFTGKCAYGLDGETCAFRCNEGYVANFNLTFTCSYGYWVQSEGHAPSEGMCADYDACSALPCDLFVSDCVDAAAPSLGYECVCKEHHVGSPGSDGRGCSRVSIATMDGNIQFKTGEAQDMEFHIGRSQFTITELSVSVEDEATRALEAEDNLQSNLLSSSLSLESTQSQTSSSLESSLNSKVSSMETSIETTTSSIENRMSSTRSTLTSTLESTTMSLATDVSINADSIDDNVAAIQSNAVRIGNVESNAAVAHGVLSTSVKNAKSQLTSAIEDVSASLETKVMSAQDSADAVDGRLTTGYYTKDEMDTMMSIMRAWTTTTFTTPAQVSAAHYTKAQVTSLLTNYYTKADSNSQYYTQSQVDSKLSSGYYTKTQSDARYYTRTQVDSTLGNYYTKSQSNGLYYTKSQSDGLYYSKSYISGTFYTRAQSDAQYYTQSTLNSRMVFPINAGAIRTMALLPSGFVGDDDAGGAYLNIYDGATAMRSTSSSLEWYQWVHVPYTWYFYRLAVYGNSSSPDMYAYYRSFSTTSSTITSICSSSSINVSIACNSGTSRTGSSYQFIVYLTGMSTSYYIYGGYYQIAKA